MKTQRQIEQLANEYRDAIKLLNQHDLSDVYIFEQILQTLEWVLED